jgi:hypothetical protein
MSFLIKVPILLRSVLVILTLFACGLSRAEITPVAQPRTQALGISAPVASFIQVEGLGRAYVGVKLSWTVPPNTTYCEMEHNVNGQKFHDYYLPASVPVTEYDMNLVWGTSHRVRVKAYGVEGLYGNAAESIFNVAQDTENNQAITWSGNWSRQTWRGWRNWGALDQFVRVASSAGASASYTFTGTAVAWLAERGQDKGKADVYLDGTRVATVDLYANDIRYCDVVFSKSGLTSDMHRLEVKVLGERNTASSGNAVTVYSFTRISP